MKITKIKILFIAIVFFIPSFVNAGCFSKKDIKFELTKSPNVKCLEVEVKDKCQGHELEITNYCDTALIYKKRSGEEIRITQFYSDPDIPMDFIIWTREIRSEKNPDNRVLIRVENKKVDEITLFLKDGIFGIIFGIIALIFTLAGVINIIKTSLRKKEKKSNNSKKL